MPANTRGRKALYSRVKRKIYRKGLDALLVTDPGDLLYMTGFVPSPPSIMLITRKGPPVYIVDTMNGPLAYCRIRGLGGSEEAVICRDRFGRLGSILKERKIRSLGVDLGSLSAREYRALRGLAVELALKEACSVMEAFRQVKQEREIKVIRKAARETVRVWQEFKRTIREGLTEKELAANLDAMVRRRGYTNSFPTIVAAGANTAYPHACPTDKRLHKDEHVLVDFGIRVDGYCSDLTRTWDNGRINRQIRSFRDMVLKAGEDALNYIRPGAGIKEPAQKVNEYFREMGVERYVRHGLGHGIGISVHEKPFLGERAKGRFKKNMVVTVEPGLYKEGLGGIREEQMVLVTGKGCEVLTV